MVSKERMLKYIENNCICDAICNICKHNNSCSGDVVCYGNSPIYPPCFDTDDEGVLEFLDQERLSELCDEEDAD